MGLYKVSFDGEFYVQANSHGEALQLAESLVRTDSGMDVWHEAEEVGSISEIDEEWVDCLPYRANEHSCSPELTCAQVLGAE